MIRSTLLPVLGLLFTGGFAAEQDSTENLGYHYQFTAIQQSHPGFSAKYSGENSLSSSSENLLSITSTLYLGGRLWQNAELYFNPELQGGAGFSLTRGVAGFPNGEVYRVDTPEPKLFIARFFLRQHFALSDEMEKVESDQNQLAGLLPKSRLTVTIGKFGLTDAFDDNSLSHDPRMQFLNWAMWSGGAWDYAADTRGYNWGLLAQLVKPDFTVNFAAVMVPSYANGPYFDHNIGKAYSLNAELVKPYRLFDEDAKLHVVAFLNHAFMGSYSEAISRAAASGTTPDIDQTNSYCSKYGFVLSLEQPLSKQVGLFSRYSWNDGRTETWAFTEIDRSFQAGLTFRGDSWHRPDDNAGIGFVVNALSQDHRDYLAAGGYGFIIGDGRLDYAWEQIIEGFYSFKMASTFWLTVDDQLIINPAYNKDRGPVVNAFAIRGHLEI